MSFLNEYVLIPVKTLNLSEPSPFDIYVKVNSKFVKVLNKDEVPDVQRINKYLSKQDDILYIESSTIEYFLDLKFGDLFDIASGEDKSKDPIAAFVRCLELCYMDIRLVRMHPDKFMRFTMLSDLAYDYFKDQFIRAKILQNLYQTAHPLARRAILGGAMGISLFFLHTGCSLRSFRSLFLGATLRDLGVTLYEGQDPHSITAEDRAALGIEDFEFHPSRTVEKLKELNLLDDALETLIMQHHELPLGNGFPLGLKRVETYKPAQCLNVADWVISFFERALANETKLNESEIIIEINKEFPEEQRVYLPHLNRVLAATLK